MPLIELNKWVICGAMAFFIFLNVLLDKLSTPVHMEFFSLLMSFKVSFVVILGKMKDLEFLGHNFSSRWMGSKSGVTNSSLILTILLT